MVILNVAFFRLSDRVRKITDDVMAGALIFSTDPIQRPSSGGKIVQR